MRKAEGPIVIYKTQQRVKNKTSTASLLSEIELDVQLSLNLYMARLQGFSINARLSLSPHPPPPILAQVSPLLTPSLLFFSIFPLVCYYPCTPEVFFSVLFFFFSPRFRFCSSQMFFFFFCQRELLALCQTLFSCLLGLCLEGCSGHILCSPGMCPGPWYPTWEMYIYFIAF